MRVAMAYGNLRQGGKCVISVIKPSDKLVQRMMALEVGKYKLWLTEPRRPLVSRFPGRRHFIQGDFDNQISGDGRVYTTQGEPRAGCKAPGARTIPSPSRKPLP